ncbi:thermonuclease family protein [Magnetovibrio sp. PR-2]|uniref:thermonuclease family protein n=1 Tax=Magnetovibrio sp. PR-2 TaxID=3120356 RepID=UPI002FCE5EF7
MAHALWAQVQALDGARVIDGDTLEVNGERHRLHGIDAPERGQTCTTASASPWPCGQAAADALREHIAGRAVTCMANGRGRYGRLISVCRVGDEDLGRWLVKHGWAVAYRRYSKAYVADEDDAREAQLGLWSGKFTLPWDWRKQRRTR